MKIESKKNGEKMKPKVKNIGMKVAKPEQTCQDTKCPFHGNLKVRGRTFIGTIISAKMHKTVVVEWDWKHYLPKYERYERRRSRVVAHNPPCLKARRGDDVIIAECRPLSKTKRFVVVAVPKRRVEQAEFRVAEIEEEAVRKARAEAPKPSENRPAEDDKKEAKRDEPEKAKHKKEK